MSLFALKTTVQIYNAVSLDFHLDMPIQYEDSNKYVYMVYDHIASSLYSFSSSKDPLVFQ